MKPQLAGTEAVNPASQPVGAPTLPAWGLPLSLVAALGRRWTLVSLVCGYVVVLLVALPQELVQDSWLTLVDGREVARHGLPSTDHLTVWTRGVRWVDQQWLAQLVFYRLEELGGVRLVLLVHVALLGTAFACALAAGRRTASARSVGFVALGTAFVAPWALQMRAQSLAFPLFVALLWLLREDSRSPSRRVFLVVPLLALWANLHGTVLLGAMLVGLHALAHGRKRLLRATTLLVLTAASLLASPYAFALPHYYRTLLLNARLHWFIDEWRPGAPSQKTALFYLLCAAAIWLVARHGRCLTRFERAALAATLLNGVLAIRGIPWFGLTCLVLLPPLVDQALPPRESRARSGPALAAIGAALVALAFAASRPPTWYLREWPTAAAPHIAALADRDPAALVLSDDRYADWLLWTEPQLRGRIAYDVRFELFTGGQFERLFRYRNRIGDDWRQAQHGYRILALDRSVGDAIAKAVQTRDGYRLVYRDTSIAVLYQSG